jgi:hypothetical protein
MRFSIPRGDELPADQKNRVPGRRFFLLNRFCCSRVRLAAEGCRMPLGNWVAPASHPPVGGGSFLPNGVQGISSQSHSW